MSGPKLPAFFSRSAAISLLALVVALLASCSPGHPSVPKALQNVLLERPLALKDFTLITQYDTPFTIANLKDHWTLMFFGYTHCPDICPTTLTEMAAFAKRIPEAQAPQIVFVSVDPARDTPAHLNQYIAFFNERFLGVTGEMADINTLTEQLGIHHSREPEVDGAYAVNHSSAILVIDPRGRFVARFSAPHYAENLQSQFELVKEFLAAAPRA